MPHMSKLILFQIVYNLIGRMISVDRPIHLILSQPMYHTPEINLSDQFNYLKWHVVRVLFSRFDLHFSINEE